jgi:acid stress-induced BolA-like protein IbaG/YrbA
MADRKSIEEAIRGAIECSHVDVRGDDGVHFEALIVSSAFQGLARVRRHQLVYAALGERMREEIHALSMRTLSPEEWAAR